MTHEDYMTAVRPKVQGTWNLHDQFQDLDFFVMLSSLVGMGVGYVARTGGVRERLARQGYQLVSEEEVLNLVEDSIASPRRLPDQSQVLVGVTSDLGIVERDNSPFLADVRFAGLEQQATSSTGGGLGKQEGRPGQDLSNDLTNAISWEHAVTGIRQAIISKLSGMFGLPENEIDPAASMAHYGVDSLVAVELRNWLSSASQSDMSIFDITQSKSLATLAEVACVKSKSVPGHLRPSS
jgi:hypothetical protein